MSETLFSDNQIIKALEICIAGDRCKECPINPGCGNYGYCTNLAIMHALNLINSQKANIDKLQEVNADLNESLRLAAEANKDLKAEVEEWKARANDWQNQYLKLIKELEIYQEHIDQDIIYAKAIKAEAIKEFAERLAAIYEKDKRYDRPDAHTLVMTVFRNIDNLVTEMTEGK